MKTHVIILAGGSGMRLWPISREELPKQFHFAIDPAQSGLSLFKQSVMRMKRLEKTKDGLLRVIAADSMKKLIAHDIEGTNIGSDCFIDEPAVRNTAPAIALATGALCAAGAKADDVVLVCPCDHLINNEKEFERAVNTAVDAAKDGHLVTFGVIPEKAETGYGYIKIRGGYKGTKNANCLPVEAFAEKPNADLAKRYVESGDYLWNAGIFCWTISAITSAYNEFFPEAAPLFKNDPPENIFKNLNSISVDYAILEKATHSKQGIVCVPLDAGWSDIGSWDAVWEKSPHDNNGNVALGDVTLLNSKNNLVRSQSRLVTAIGMNDMIVVDTQDALFLTPRGSSQQLKELTQALSKTHSNSLKETPFDSRQWGTYEIITQGPCYKVKRITVLPDKRLSLQKHQHRSEHWVVIAGTATVTLKESADIVNNEMQLEQGKNVFIPAGWIHRLANFGKIPCEIIEVQIGDYLGEDDITRLEDDYSR